MTNRNAETLLYVCLLFLLAVFPAHLHAQQPDNTRKTHVYTSGSNDMYDSLVIDSGRVIFHTRFSRSEQALQRKAPVPAVNTTSINSVAAAGLTVSAMSAPSTCFQSNGRLVILASGGTPPYVYNYNGWDWQSSGVLYLSGGATYTVGVKDATGATAYTTVFVGNNGVGPTLFAKMLINPTGCIGADGVMELTATGGTSPYTYTLDGFNYQTSNIFNNITPGIYEPIVKDAFGCSRAYWFLSANGAGCNRFYISMGYSQSTCTNTGSVSFTPQGSPPGIYTYSNDGGINYQTSPTFNNLSWGLQTFHIKNSAGDINIISLYIRYFCEITLTVTATDASCGTNDGQLAVAAANGISPYEYSIDGFNFQSSGIFTGLATGNYTVTIKDASGTIKTVYAIIEDDCPEVTATSIDAACGVANGSITASNIGGVAPFQYSIDGGLNYQNSHVFTGLAPGPYTVTIKDGRGLTGNTQVTIGDRCMQVNATPVNATCGNNNGSITVSVGNGIPPYQYSLDGSNWQNSNVFAGLGAGTYSVIVKDAGALTATASNIVITQTSGPVFIPVTSPANCNGEAGSITITVSGGTAPFLYSLDGNGYQNSNVFNNVNAGNHTVSVRDANTCIISGAVQVTIDNTTAPRLSANAHTATCLNNDGIITASVNSGTSPFEYSLNGTVWQPLPQFDKLPAGNYTIQVRDANTCTDLVPVVVPFTNNLTVETGNDLTICEGKDVVLNGITNLSAASLSWTPAKGLNNTNVSNPTANPVVTTKYYVTAGLGVCQAIDSIIVNVRPAPVANAGIGGAVCFGNSFQLQGSGGMIYQWSPSTYLSDARIADPVVTKPSNTITYYLSVTDFNQCTSLQAAPVTVSVTPPAEIYVGRDTSIAAGQPLPLLARDVNNSGFISYTWSPATGLNNPGIQAPIATPASSISYRVVASTPAGCEGVGSIAIKVYKAADIYVPSAFSPNGDRRNDVFKAIPIGIKEFKYLVVYNRWGGQVFLTSNAATGWDGSIKGIMQTGTFVWMAAGIDYLGNPIQRKGTVTITR